MSKLALEKSRAFFEKDVLDIVKSVVLKQPENIPVFLIRCYGSCGGSVILVVRIIDLLNCLGLKLVIPTNLNEEDCVKIGNLSLSKDSEYRRQLFAGDNEIEGRLEVNKSGSIFFKPLHLIALDSEVLRLKAIAA